MNFARSAFLVSIRAGVETGESRASVTLETEIPGPDIRYTLDGSDPGPSSKRYVKPIVLKKTSEIRAAAFEGPKRVSPGVSAERFLVHAASGRVPRLASPPSPRYAGSGETTLTDGLLGSRNHADGRWQGFEGSDLEAVIDLGGSRPVHRIAGRYLQNINAWIFLPTSVEFAVSTDGKVFEAVSTVANDVSPRLADITIKEFAGSFLSRPVRYVRVRAKAISFVPAWHFGAGGKAWLFADEIIVE